MSYHIKICGLKDPEMVDIAIEAGADMIGLVFFAKSPRYLSPEQAAHVALAARSRAATVGLFVNAPIDLLKAVTSRIPLSHLQLHGEESPERVRAIKQQLSLPILKAVGIEQSQDLDRASAFSSLADMLLLDAKPPKDAVLPGGNGAAFNWQLLHSLKIDSPWLLAGGLTPDNVQDAINVAKDIPGFAGVDVSSGVEGRQRVKDPILVQEFIKNAQEVLSAIKVV